MHELSIALSILEFAEEEGARRGEPVAAVYIRLGSLSGVNQRALSSAFDLAREATALSNCRLEIEEVPAAIHCGACSEDQIVDPAGGLLCPRCHAPARNLIRGKELQVIALEMLS